MIETQDTPLALTSLLRTHHTHLQTIADSWLRAGAAGFGLQTQNKLVMSFGTANDTPSLSVPLKVNGRTQGEVCVYGLNGESARTKLQSDASLIATLVTLESEITSMTLELIGNQDQLLALYELNESLRNRLEMGEVLSTLAQVGIRLARAQATCAALMLESEPTVSYYPEPFLRPQAVVELFERLRSTRNRLLVEGAMLHLSLSGMALIEPIYARGQILAFLCVVRDGEPFHSPDLKLMRAVCDHAGGQIENALLYQETLAQARFQTEMEMAQRVQAQMLPQRIPQIAGLEIAAGALTALQVGGDVYDFIQNPGNPFMFMIGDVSGKGMSAALLMSAIRTLVRSRARVTPAPSPAEIMAGLNEDLYDDFTELSMFATTFFGQYEIETRQLCYANAGHSPIIYRPAGGRAALLEADAPPIGVLPESLCQNQTISFNSGDILVILTDGFSEAADPNGVLFGYERLLNLVDTLADQWAEAIAVELFNSVAAFSDGHAQDDDQTLIVLKGV
ncbi:MAG: SpoIIE family protein phosphatase [Anaerolineae bacterium]|nr:SpoIIE family protein phosphatase [Anaerolineae bacterium]